MTDTTLTQQQRYTAVAITLHWIIALSIIGMIALGWTMTSMPEGRDLLRPLPAPQVDRRHHPAAFGRPRGLAHDEPASARAAHARTGSAASPSLSMSGFYVLIIAMPLTGWIMASAL